MKAIPIAAAGLLLGVLACSDTTTPDTTAPTPSEPSAAVAAAASPLVFWQLSGGTNHTCAVTTDFVPYCWGANGSPSVPEASPLGTGSTTGPDVCVGSNDISYACATTPALVAGGHRFRGVSAGDVFTCGVTADFHAWCWGANNFGQLGTGTTTSTKRPVAVSGGLLFRQVDVGDNHTCGVTTGNRVYCWGANYNGQVGDNTLSRRLKPVLVLLAQSVSAVSAGGSHSCAITSAGRAFCWGLNSSGQLGDSTNAFRRTRPSAVVGAHVFRQIDAGSRHTCAVTTDDRAFCWGDGRDGEVGNGKSYLSYWPRAVSGGLRIRRVSTGSFHTCAETTSGKAWCWGNNSLGQLGTGNPGLERSLIPVAVAGGLTFGQLDAGPQHNCGKTTAGAGYCWGFGFFAALGNGASGEGATRYSPVAVATPE